jgi:ParB family chromosome partitioning protein
MERRVLGKGLDALIPRKEIIKENDLVYLPLQKIKPSPYQPRTEVDQQELNELTQSIKEKGLIQPIVVRRKGEEYQVVAGHRRFNAAKALGINELPALIKELSDKDTLIYAMVENIQRKDLNPLEEALGFQRLHDEFGLTHEAIGALVGKDKTSVSNTLRLLKLPGEIRDALKKGLINRSQARTLLGLDDSKKQRILFYKILQEKTSVREIEDRVRKTSAKKRRSDPFVVDLEEKLRKALGTKVQIHNKKNNSGKITIMYYNLDDLERIIKQIQ